MKPVLPDADAPVDSVIAPVEPSDATPPVRRTIEPDPELAL
jgi:hypothetical protein